jgi:peptide methionine sulfoxide reductase MsrB
MNWPQLFSKIFRKKKHDTMHRRVRVVEECGYCNGFGGHVEQGEFSACTVCEGDGFRE